MSLNKYDPLTGTLTTLANGQRIWLGTKAAHDAAEAAGTLPTNCLIAITDDGDVSGVVDAVENGNMDPVTSNAVAKAIPKVVQKIGNFTTNSSGYLFLPKGTFSARVDYLSCILLPWPENEISHCYINQSTALVGYFNPNTTYSVIYDCIEYDES